MYCRFHAGNLDLKSRDMAVDGDIMYFSCISVNVVSTMRANVREVKLAYPV
jgi:hypothetical protein